MWSIGTPNGVSLFVSIVFFEAFSPDVWEGIPYRRGYLLHGVAGRYGIRLMSFNMSQADVISKVARLHSFIHSPANLTLTFMLLTSHPRGAHFVSYFP
jgi:hypothetical protein